MKKRDFVLMFEARSLALQAKYKPRIMLDFAKSMVREVKEEHLETSDVWEDMCAAYEKLGYMLYAKRKLRELDSRIAYWTLVAEYHTSNFIFHCKAFLDCISNAIYHAFNLDIKNPVNRDITREEFNKKLTMKNPLFADKIKPFLKWAKYIAGYRMELIHKYQFFSLSEAPTFTKLEIIREPTKPLILFDKKRSDAFFRKMKNKYGSPTILIHDFMEESLDKTMRFFETIISEFLEEIRHKGSNIFDWETIDTSHMQIKAPKSSH